MKVVIAGGGTGGHLMPALAIAEGLEDAGIACVLVGAARGVEADILPRRRFKYHLLPSEPIYRRALWKNLRWVLLAGKLFKQALQLLDDEQPDMVIGTGGYAAAAPLFAARRRRIPIVLQEQNAYPGMTTRRFARHARAVFLGFPEAAGYLRCPPSVEIVHTGNPVSVPGTRAERGRGGAEPVVEVGAPVVFVMGGSQGSLAINQAMSAALEDGLAQGCTVLWSTGTRTFDLFERYHSPPAVHVRPFWDPVEEAYDAADLVVSRAGAMTISELCVFGKPAVLVPLPTAAADHQRANALAMARAGAAVHLPEAELTGRRLAREVAGLTADEEALATMGERALAHGKPGATREIVDRLSSLIRKV